MFFRFNNLTLTIISALQVKLAISGSWESALLKVTWPDDTIPDEVLVSDDTNQHSQLAPCFSSSAITGTRGLLPVKIQLRRTTTILRSGRREGSCTVCSCDRPPAPVWKILFGALFQNPFD